MRGWAMSISILGHPRQGWRHCFPTHFSFVFSFHWQGLVIVSSGATVQRTDADVVRSSPHRLRSRFQSIGVEGMMTKAHCHKGSMGPCPIPYGLRVGRTDLWGKNARIKTCLFFSFHYIIAIACNLCCLVVWFVACQYCKSYSGGALMFVVKRIPLSNIFDAIFPT